MKIRVVNTEPVRLDFNGNSNIKDGITKWMKDKGNLSVIVPHCQVYLYNQHDGHYIRSTFSDKDGKYAFKNLNMKDFTFFVIAHHPTAEANGVIADNIGGGHEMD